MHRIDFAFYWLKSTSANWRVPIALQCVFSIILMCTVMSLPEAGQIIACLSAFAPDPRLSSSQSPRWLIKVGREQEARQVFAALADVPDDDEMVAAQVQEVAATLSISTGGLRGARSRVSHAACGPG